MRDYAKVSPAFWTGPTGRGIVQAGPEAVTCAFYLMTSPHGNAIGLYYLPTPYIGFDLNLPMEAIQESLAVCVAAGFCSYDTDSAFVWVYEMAHYQTAAELTPKDNRHKAMVKLYGGLTKNPYLGAFYDRYGKAYQLPRRRSGAPLSEVLKQGFTPPSKGLQSPLQAPLKGETSSAGTLQSPTAAPIHPSKPLASPLQAPPKPETETEAETEAENNTSAADADRLAGLLLSLIRERNPDHKQPNLKRWAQDLGRAIRIDKRTPQQLEAVIRFAQADEFWCSNILSGEKVREKFDQLVLKAKRGHGGKQALLQPTTYAQAKHADRQANVELVERLIHAEENGYTAGHPGSPGKTEPDLLPS